MKPTTEQAMEQIVAMLKPDFEEMKADREERTAEGKAYREKLMPIFGADQGETSSLKEGVM
jgi:hypothetical protein